MSQKIHLGMNDLCWEYNKSTFSNGYSRIFIKRKAFGAHVVSYIVFKGRIAYEVHHRCDNRRCINPDHLIDAKHVEHCRQSSYTALTKEQAAKIKESEGSVGRLAQLFKVSISTIYKIREGLRWQEN